MQNQKTTLAGILEREFNNEIFTHYAVMTWHHEGDLDQWKKDFVSMVESGQLVEVEKRPLGTVYTQRDSLKISWNCCTGGKEPDWSNYDALQLAGVAEEEVDGETYIERVEEMKDAKFMSLYAHIKDGGYECIHDFPVGIVNKELILKECNSLAEKLNFKLSDYTDS